MLACSSYQFVQCIEEYRAVIRAFSMKGWGGLNYELSIQRLTSDAAPWAPLTVKMCEECSNNTWWAPYALTVHGRYCMSLWPCLHENQISKPQLHKRLPASHPSGYNFSQIRGCKNFSEHTEAWNYETTLMFKAWRRWRLNWELRQMLQL